MKKKKLFSILCAISLMSSMIATPTFAEELDTTSPASLKDSLEDGEEITINLDTLNVQNYNTDKKEPYLEIYPEDVTMEGYATEYDEAEDKYYFTYIEDENEIYRNIIEENIKIERATMKPDLSIEVIEPTIQKGLNGQDELEPNSEFATYIRTKVANEGDTDVNKPFEVSIQIKDQIIKGELNKLPAGRSVILETRGIFHGIYEEFPFIAKVDPERVIKEETYITNNTWTGTYYVKYCTHQHSFSSRGKNKDIDVWITSDIVEKMNSTSEQLASEIAQWNGITDNVHIVGYHELRAGTEREVFYQRANANDILILMGNSKETGNDIARSTTNTQNGKQFKVVYCWDEKWDLQGSTRTIKHELGHLFGLAHPNDRGPCDYHSIMFQSNHKQKSENVLQHDKYNLIQFN